MAMTSKTRNQKKREQLELIVKAAAFVVVLALAVLLLLGLSRLDDEPSVSPDDRQRQFEAQKRYYEILDRYGDKDAAEDAARRIWEGENDG